MTVASRSFNSLNVLANDRAEETGDFNEGFAIKLYGDSEMTKSVNSGAKIYIGSIIYTEVTWNVKSLEEKVQFYIKNCRIEQMIDEKPLTVTIVSDNCYSAAVKARLQQARHLSNRSSKFSYKSFTVGNHLPQSLDHQERLSCDIHLCTTNQPTCKLVTQDDDCPSKGTGYLYKLRGAVI